MERIDPGRLDSAIEQQVSYLKKINPVGVAEYLRRRGIMDSAPEWQRLVT